MSFVGDIFFENNDGILNNIFSIFVDIILRKFRIYYEYTVKKYFSSKKLVNLAGAIRTMSKLWTIKFIYNIL